MRDYFGVSGLANRQQQEVIQQIALDNGINSGLTDLMVGVKATEKTQWLDMPNKYGTDWYPVGDELKTSFGKIIDFDDLEATGRTGFIQPTVQMFFGSLADDFSLAVQFTDKVLARSSGWTRYAHNGSKAARVALQFDKFPWMNPTSNEYFEWLVNSREVSEFIMQCHGDYMESYHPYEVVRRLGQIIELGATPLRVLFDASHGTGKEMDPEILRPFIGAVVDSTASEGVGVVVAGGLCGENLEQFIPPLIDEFGMLSWDAEGMLHHKNGSNNGNFITEQLRRYIEVSAEIHRSYDIDDYGTDED